MAGDQQNQRPRDHGNIFPRDASRHMSQIFQESPAPPNGPTVPSSASRTPLNGGYNPLRRETPVTRTDYSRMSFTPRATPRVTGRVQDSLSMYRSHRNNISPHHSAGIGASGFISTRPYPQYRQQYTSQGQASQYNQFSKYGQTALGKSSRGSARHTGGDSNMNSGDVFRGRFRPESTYSRLPPPPIDIPRPGGSAGSSYPDYEDWLRPEKLNAMYRTVVLRLAETNFPYMTIIDRYTPPGPWVDYETNMRIANDPHRIRGRPNKGVLYAAFEHFYALIDTGHTNHGLEGLNYRDVVRLLQSVSCPYVSSLEKGVLDHPGNENSWFICLGSLHWLARLSDDFDRNLAKLNEPADMDDKGSNARDSAANEFQDWEQYFESTSLELFSLRAARASESVVKAVEEEMHSAIEKSIEFEKSSLVKRSEALKKREQQLDAIKERNFHAQSIMNERTNLEKQLADLQQRYHSLLDSGSKDADLEALEKEISIRTEERKIMQKVCEQQGMTISRVLETTSDLDKLRTKRSQLLAQSDTIKSRLEVSLLPPLEHSALRIQDHMTRLNNGKPNKLLRLELIDPLGSNFGVSTDTLLGGSSLDTIKSRWKRELIDVMLRNKLLTKKKTDLQQSEIDLNSRFEELSKDMREKAEAVTELNDALTEKRRYLSNVTKENDSMVLRVQANLQKKQDDAQKKFEHCKSELEKQVHLGLELDAEINKSHPIKLAAVSELGLMTLIHDTIGSRLLNLSKTVDNYVSAVGNGRARLANFSPTIPLDEPSPEMNESVRTAYRKMVSSAAGNP